MIAESAGKTAGLCRRSAEDGFLVREKRGHITYLSIENGLSDVSPLFLGANTSELPTGYPMTILLSHWTVVP